MTVGPGNCPPRPHNKQEPTFINLNPQHKPKGPDMYSPDTDHGITEEQQEQIGEALAHWAEAAPFPANARQEMIDDLLPVLAAIRRQAAADALTEQASAFDRQAGFFVNQQNAMLAKGDQASADVYTEYVDHGHRAATKLRQAAADKLAEGYEWQCASGRGCDAPVPDAGDECARCHAEGDDEDRWAE